MRPDVAAPPKYIDAPQMTGVRTPPRIRLGYGGRVGGRYVLSTDYGGAASTWVVKAMSSTDEYPCLDDSVPDVREGDITAAIAELPDDLRAVVELVVLGVVGHREAGRILGIDHKTVARRLRRATALLASSLAHLEPV
jgi:hypothetical protein